MASHCCLLFITGAKEGASSPVCFLSGHQPDDFWVPGWPQSFCQFLSRNKATSSQVLALPQGPPEWWVLRVRQNGLPPLYLKLQGRALVLQLPMNTDLSVPVLASFGLKRARYSILVWSLNFFLYTFYLFIYLFFYMVLRIERSILHMLGEQLLPLSHNPKPWSLNIFPHVFHLCGPRSAPSDLTESDCPLLPTTALQRPEDKQYIFSLFQAKTVSFTPSWIVHWWESIVVQSELSVLEIPYHNLLTSCYFTSQRQDHYEE